MSYLLRTSTPCAISPTTVIIHIYVIHVKDTHVVKILDINTEIFGPNVIYRFGDLNNNSTDTNETLSYKNISLILFSKRAHSLMLVEK